MDRCHAIKTEDPIGGQRVGVFMGRENVSSSSSLERFPWEPT